MTSKIIVTSIIVTRVLVTIQLLSQDINSDMFIIYSDE